MVKMKRLEKNETSRPAMRSELPEEDRRNRGTHDEEFPDEGLEVLRDMKELVAKLSKTKPKAVVINGTYKASEQPEVAIKHVRFSMTQNGWSDLENKGCAFDRVREAMTESGELNDLTPRILLEFLGQLDSPSPKIPKSMMSMQSVQRVLEDLKAQSVAFLLWIAGQHSETGEVGRMAQKFAEEQMQGKCEDGVRRFVTFLSSRVVGISKAELFRKDRELVDGRFDLSNGKRLEIALIELQDEWNALAEGMRKYGRVPARTLHELEAQWVYRGIVSAGKERSEAARPFCDQLRMVDPDSELYEYDEFELKLRLLVKAVDALAHRDGLAHGQETSTAGAKKSEPRTTTRAAAAKSNLPLKFCEACKETGHYVTDCEANPLVPGADNVVTTVKCHRCLAYGHRSPSCPAAGREDEEDRKPKNGGGPRKAAAEAALAAGRSL